MENLDASDSFTPAQNHVLAHVKTLLFEHFSDALIVVGSKPDDAEPVTKVAVVGSHKEALGNLSYASAFLMSSLHRIK